MNRRDVGVTLAFGIGLATGATIGTLMLGGYALVDLVRRAI